MPAPAFLVDSIKKIADELLELSLRKISRSEIYLKIKRRYIGEEKPNNFEEVYLSTLVELWYQKADNAILKLFREKPVIKAFYDHVYHQLSETDLLQAIHDTANTKSPPVKAALKTFTQEFDRQTTRSASVFETRLEELANIKNQPSLLSNDETGHYDPSTLFSYKQRYTTFIGRQKEQDLLSDFLQAGDQFCWLLITGAGGSGKSRLALECAHAARGLGFHAGFVDSLKKFDWTHWDSRRPTLLIIDYVHSVYEEVTGLIRELRNREKHQIPGRPVRLLLLDRELRSEWEGEIKIDDAIRQTNYMQRQGQSILQLEGLDAASRWAIVTEVIEKAHQDNKLSLEQMQALLADETAISETLQELDDKRLPLYTFFSAVALVQTGNIRNWNTDRLLEHHLIWMERHYWGRAGITGMTLQNCRKLYLINTLCIEIQAPELANLCKKLKIADADQDKYRSVVERQSDAGDGELLFLGLEPDLLGEFYIVSTLEKIMREDKAAARTLLELTWRTRPENVWRMIWMTVMDFGRDAETGGISGRPVVSCLLDIYPLVLLDALVVRACLGKLCSNLYQFYLRKSPPEPKTGEIYLDAIQLILARDNVLVSNWETWAEAIACDCECYADLDLDYAFGQWKRLVAICEAILDPLADQPVIWEKFRFQSLLARATDRIMKSKRRENIKDSGYSAVLKTLANQWADMSSFFEAFVFSEEDFYNYIVTAAKLLDSCVKRGIIAEAEALFISLSKVDKGGGKRPVMAAFSAHKLYHYFLDVDPVKAAHYHAMVEEFLSILPPDHEASALMREAFKQLKFNLT